MPGEASSLVQAARCPCPVLFTVQGNHYLDSRMLKCAGEGVNRASKLCIGFQTVSKPLLEFTLNLQTCFPLALSYFVVASLRALAQPYCMEILGVRDAVCAYRLLFFNYFIIIYSLHAVSGKATQTLECMPLVRVPRAARGSWCGLGFASLSKGTAQSRMQ